MTHLDSAMKKLDEKDSKTCHLTPQERDATRALIVELCVEAIKLALVLDARSAATETIEIRKVRGYDPSSNGSVQA